MGRLRLRPFLCMVLSSSLCECKQRTDMSRTRVPLLPFASSTSSPNPKPPPTPSPSPFTCAFQHISSDLIRPRSLTTSNPNLGLRLSRAKSRYGSRSRTWRRYSNLNIALSVPFKAGMIWTVPARQLYLSALLKSGIF